MCQPALAPVNDTRSTSLSEPCENASRIARDEGSRLVLTVKVTPKAARPGLGEVVDDGRGGHALQVKVAAAPEAGKANAAVEALLAQMLGCPKSAVSVIAGQTSRLKRVAVDGEGARLLTTLETHIAGALRA